MGGDGWTACRGRRAGLTWPRSAAPVIVAAPALGAPVLGDWAAGAGVVVLPVAVGAAILRYRLYDLDRIVSRTLAYGLLTVLLASAYAGVVLGLGQLLPQDSSLVVAAATLAVAAVFQPARRRVQQAVDRRGPIYDAPRAADNPASTVSLETSDGPLAGKVAT